MAVSEYVGNTYQQIQQAVADYYGSGSDAWARIYAGAGGYYSEDAAKVIKQVPGVSVTYSNSGKVLGYSYANPYPAAEKAASVINSNVQTGSYGEGSFTNSLPSTVVDNGQGQLVAQSGSRLAATGAKVATVVDRLSLAAVGVSLGTKLGKAIDSGIYSVAPDWWDTHYPAVNPETWDDIATTQGGRQLIQGIFGLENDSTTMYLDERLLAQTYMMLLANGGYSENYEAIIEEVSKLVHPEYFNQPLLCAPIASVTYSDQYTNNATFTYTFSSGSGYMATFNCSDGLVRGVAVSDNPFVLQVLKNGTAYSTGNGISYQNKQGTSYYVYTFPSYARNPVSHSSGDNDTTTSSITNSPFATDVATIIYEGNLRQLSLEGIQDDPRAQTYIDKNLITGTTLDEVLQQLKQNYPELFADAIYQDTPQEDGSVDRTTYIPVPIPNGITTPTPITGETSQTNPSVNPDDNSEGLLRNIIQLLTHPETEPQTETQPETDTPTLTPTSSPPDTGDGSTPIIPPIAGSASSLWKIYNPSQSEIDAFGAWLWSSNFIDQIKKLFNDPMQAIIGVHKVFCDPAIGGVATIKCGYLDSGVSSNWVSDQYTHIDCGTVNLPEYFGNVFDYDPFTRVSLFLPCIGIVPLDVAEVMRASVNVKLHCDVLTGALLAEVNVIRDQAGGILYTYSGSCIVTYPVSSGTYMGAVANVVSVAASVAAGIMSTVASGGALAPLAMGAAGASASGLAHTRTNVQHSGSFSGAAGVMGGKIPYLIITRPQTRMADQYPIYDGVPANFTSRLGDCTGYIKVKEVHLKAPNAFESEISEIEQLLHQGVLI